MKIFKCLIALLLISSFVNAQKDIISYHYDPTAQPKDRNIDIFHMEADLKITPEINYVEAEVIFDFRPYRLDVDSISFLTYSMKIQSIEIDKEQVEFREHGNYTVIEDLPMFIADKAYQITFSYNVEPKVQLYNTGWQSKQNTKPKQIWAHRPHEWLPYYEDRFTVEMIITTKDDLMVVSNGIRESVKDNENGTKTWHYKMKTEHPFFSTCLVIGNYKYKTFETNNGLPLEYWYYPDKEDHYEPTYRYSEKMFDILENEFGFSYPYELYRNIPVSDYLYGAMETTTSTIFGDYMHVDDRGYLGRNYVNVNAHELVHQWFGNFLSHLTNQDVWLTESFATYYAKIVEKEIYGEDYYQWERNRELIRTFNAAKKNDFGVGHGQAGSDRWYPKGSLVMDMLRDVLGEEAFKKSIYHYLKTNELSVVETTDFLKAIREASGYSMEWFFEQWIYRGGEPHYKVSYSEIEKNDKNYTQINVEQIHKTDQVIGLFKMPIEIEVHYVGGDVSKKKVWIENKYHSILIENPKRKDIAFVIFDPNRKIIKKLSFERSSIELCLQALMAPNMIDRYDALLALQKITFDEKDEALKMVFGSETFHMTKSEALSQLLQNPTNELIKAGITDRNHQVRKIVLEEIKTVPISLEKEYKTLLSDSSFVNVELALENLVRSFPENAGQYFDITKDEEGWRGNNIRIKWLELKMEMGNDQHLEELIGYSNINEYEFETVQNAIEALVRLNYLDEKVIENLIDAYLYWNYKVSRTAASAIKSFMEITTSKKMIIDYIDKKDWEPFERSKVVSLLK